ncbi:MarR family winged helix-turn-helix transcriptional regulator [Novosphingobium panipatense]
MTQPTTSDAAAALVRKGYVEKRPDPADARAAQLHPTDAGTRLAGQLAVWPDALLAAVDMLDDSERAAFLKGLTKMIGALQMRGAIPSSACASPARTFGPMSIPMRPVRITAPSWTRLSATLRCVSIAAITRKPTHPRGLKAGLASQRSLPMCERPARGNERGARLSTLG